MSSTVIFKVRYNPRTNPKSGGLNVRNLQYISTRPGTVFNEGCGFGLWGQLPGQGNVGSIDNLRQARELIKEASAAHTIYRGVLSVDKITAQTKGLYDRSRWEKLINAKVSVIAKEMDIKDFAWCASFHYKKNQPHAHLLFWDNSPDPRPDFTSKERFEIMSERVRAAFAGEIYREEIRDAQRQQREQTKELRDAIRAVCLEANPEKALDLSRLQQNAAMITLGDQLLDLARAAPSRGSLRYAYLPAEYKAKVDAFTKACLELPELAKEMGHYEHLTDEISRLYANGKEAAEVNLEKAKSKLMKELGNQTMEAVRSLMDALPAQHLSEALSQTLPGLESYRELVALLPPERIPLSAMDKQIPDWQEKVGEVAKDAASHTVVRKAMDTAALESAGIDLDEKPQAAKGEKSTDGRHILNGRILDDEEWAAYSGANREQWKELYRDIAQSARADAGWAAEQAQTNTAMLLCGFMRLISQLTRQRGANLALAQKNLKSRDLSKDARKDIRAKMQQAGSWDMELN